MDHHEREMLQNILELLHQLVGYADAKSDFRPALRFVEDSNVLPFRVPSSDQPTKTDNAKLGYVEFTDKEMKQMPTHFRRLILVNKKRCRMRVRQSGENSTTYEIRYRCDGYNLSASGKTIELAKAKMLEKMKSAKPNKEEGFPSVPSGFTDFTLYFFKKFREPKISSETYYKDLNRLKKHAFPYFGNMPFSKITPNVCQQLLDELSAKGLAKTATEIYSLLSVILKGAIAHALIERNPLDIVVHIKQEHEHGKSLTREEERALMQSVGGTPRGILYAIMLYAGLRPNELETVRIEGPFLVAKNSKRKTQRIEYKRIFISNKLADVLKGVTEIPKLHLKYISTEFKKFCPNHKMYDLRTTFNTRCKELGVSDHARMHFMGHSLGALGNAYTDLSDEYLLKEGKKLNKW